MKTSYKVTRGRVWHVVHETKTGAARVSAWTLCGGFYEQGERGNRQPTCPNCLRLDNPLFLSPRMRDILRDAARIKNWQDAPKHTAAFDHLVQVDYITQDARLTRRGAILMEDFEDGAVPLSDDGGVAHARRPLGRYPLCNPQVQAGGAEQMTTERYAKLRKVSDQVMVTCLQCLAYEDVR